MASLVNGDNCVSSTASVNRTAVIKQLRQSYRQRQTLIDANRDQVRSEVPSDIIKQFESPIIGLVPCDEDDQLRKLLHIDTTDENNNVIDDQESISIESEKQQTDRSAEEVALSPKRVNCDVTRPVSRLSRKKRPDQLNLSPIEVGLRELRKLLSNGGQPRNDQANGNTITSPAELPAYSSVDQATSSDTSGPQLNIVASYESTNNAKMLTQLRPTPREWNVLGDMFNHTTTSTFNQRLGGKQHTLELPRTSSSVKDVPKMSEVKNSTKKGEVTANHDLIGARIPKTPDAISKPLTPPSQTSSAKTPKSPSVTSNCDLVGKILNGQITTTKSHDLQVREMIAKRKAEEKRRAEQLNKEIIKNKLEVTVRSVRFKPEENPANVAAKRKASETNVELSSEVKTTLRSFESKNVKKFRAQQIESRRSFKNNGWSKKSHPRPDIALDNSSTNTAFDGSQISMEKNNGKEDEFNKKVAEKMAEFRAEIEAKFAQLQPRGLSEEELLLREKFVNDMSRHIAEEEVAKELRIAQLQASGSTNADVMGHQDHQPEEQVVIVSECDGAEGLVLTSPLTDTDTYYFVVLDDDGGNTNGSNCDFNNVSVHTNVNVIGHLGDASGNYEKNCSFYSEEPEVITMQDVMIGQPLVEDIAAEEVLK